MLKLPFLQSKIQAEIKKTTDDFRNEIKNNNLSTVMQKLPEQGMSWEEIDQRLNEV